MHQRDIRAEVTVYADDSISMFILADGVEVDDLKGGLSRSEQIRLRHTLGLYRDRMDKIINDSK